MSARLSAMATWTLGIDTAGPNISLALWDISKNCPGPSFQAELGVGADAYIAPTLRRLLDHVDSTGGRLHAVGVSAGPGAFTSLRVGLATAAATAFARGVPVVPWSSLSARAAAFPGAERVIALLDARRGQVYGGLYTVPPGSDPVCLREDEDCPLETLLSLEPSLAVGEGASTFSAELLARGHRLAPPPELSPALCLAAFAARMPGISPLELRLVYLRAPDARLPSTPLRGNPSAG
jgi:tRNA threonylcarbamoyladenosine biosynthesis protein TsaB